MIHPRTKLDVGYRLSRSGLAVAYGFTNITYLGPIISNIHVGVGSKAIKITYSNVASPQIELRNSHGFEICCHGKEICSTNETLWNAALASQIPEEQLAILLTVPSECIDKTIDGLRYLWRETPCLFKQAAIYNSLDSNIPAGPYIHFF